MNSQGKNKYYKSVWERKTWWEWVNEAEKVCTGSHFSSLSGVYWNNSEIIKQVRGQEDVLWWLCETIWRISTLSGVRWERRSSYSWVWMISSDCSLMRSRSTLDKSSVNQSGTSSSQSAVKHAAMNEQNKIKMFKFSLEVETSLHNDNLRIYCMKNIYQPDV